MSSINDKSDWKTVRKALSVTEFSESDTEVRLDSTLTVFNLYLILQTGDYSKKKIPPLCFLCTGP